MQDVYLIGNAHLDPVWLWRWQDGFSEILATYRSALDRLYEFPNMKFTSACAVYYQWIEKLDPDMFREIQEMVRAGRWEITGGWFLQPDCNIPDGESFMRHALISQRYFREKFGITATTGYNVDSFGHNGALPKILRASGMENYVFMRPSTAEQGWDKSLFYWESDDGSRVCTFRIPIRYNINAQRLDQLEEICQKADREDTPLMAFYGVGNHGGGPTIRILHAFEQLQDPHLRYGTTEEYFSAVKTPELPVHTGELQHHARGCYSAETTVKRLNRKCEQNLLAAERFCLMAQQLTGLPYPAKKLRKGWKNLLFAQFHDIMGGCCIRSAYEDTRALLGETMSITEQAIEAAIQSIAWNIDTLQGERLPAYKYDLHDKGQWAIWEHEVLGTPVVVFNPHAWAVTGPVKVYAYACKMTDEQGREIPFQLVRGEQTDGADRSNTVFMAEVPPMGYRVYRLFTEKTAQTVPQNELRITAHSLENSHMRIELDDSTGDICLFTDKRTGKNLIEKPCRAVLLDESACDTWAHDKKSLGATVDTFGNPRFEIIERGPVCSAIRVTTRCGHSVLQRIYRIYAGQDRVTVDTRVDFHARHRALKLTFPLTQETVLAKIPYGSLKRTGYTGEEPCGSWFASGGLCVANDCKYAYDTQDGEMRMTVLRGAIYNDHFGHRDSFCQYMDQGEHTFVYSLYPSGSPSSNEKRAQELNFGLRRVVGTFRKGKLPEHSSCIRVDEPDILVTAVKQIEDADGMILRFYEADGLDTVAHITLFDKTICVEAPHNCLKTVDADGILRNAMEWEE